MYVYLKYLLFATGLLAALIGNLNHEIAVAIVSVDAFISFALIEIRDLKALNDYKNG